MKSEYIRRNSAQIKAGTLYIGGTADISVQTMATVPLEKTDECIKQVNSLADRGADLVRIALRNMNEARMIPFLIEKTHVPICADIHFDYRIAITAIEGGIHKIRLNPGNIGKIERVLSVAKAAKERNVPIRIGVNGGSLDKSLYPFPTPHAMCESALTHISLLEKCGFNSIAVSLKSSDIRMTVEANRMIASRIDYPLHIGLTEAGFGMQCLIQSGAAIGSLLIDGIGDTIRISMTGDPANEVDAGFELLRSIGLIDYGIRIISCPTCGRTGSPEFIEKTAEEIHDAAVKMFSARLKKQKRTLTLAVMGCEVNGPGEAGHADAGLAGAGPDRFLVFSRGKSRGTVPAREGVKALLDAAEEIIST